MRLIMLIVMATLTTTGCQSGKSSSTDLVQLRGDEIRGLFSGKTVESVSSSTGITSFTFYNENGTLLQERFWQIREGTWKINESNEICLAIENKKEKCRIILMDSGSFFNKYKKKYYKFRLTKSGSQEKIVRYRQFIDGNLILKYQ